MTDHETETADPAGEQHDNRPDTGPTGSSDDTDGGVGGGRSAAEYAQFGALAVLLLVALVATLQFYFAASAAVSTFVTERYQPLFRAAFNLVVLVAAAAGVTALVRRLN